MEAVLATRPLDFKRLLATRLAPTTQATLAVGGVGASSCVAKKRISRASNPVAVLAVLKLPVLLFKRASAPMGALSVFPH
jgi:hypothetical protein